MMMERQEQHPHPHEALRELCALSAAGVLSPEERVRLEAHLQTCADCRERYVQYRALARDGMSFLAGGIETEEDVPDWDDRHAKLRLLASVDSVRAFRPHGAPQAGPRVFQRANNWAVAAIAASVLILVASGSYWLGEHALLLTHPTYESVLKKFREVDLERTALNRANADHVQREIRLEADKDRLASEGAQLRTDIQNLNSRTEGLAANVTERDAQVKDLEQQRDALQSRFQEADRSYQESKAQVGQLKAAAQERDALAARLHSIEERYQIAQSELAKLADQAKGSDDSQLKAEVRTLSDQLHEQKRDLERSGQFLAADRDIRELMGARQLYIADVFDVGGDGRTRRPFGRVFYTRSKSLIFYAFDLDHQPGVKNTSTFQVWGQREAVQGESARPVNLGVLYMDSESNRRWVLKSEDPRQLSEIDAVFVTVEPNGGSVKPTGKPFLYALLRKNANHP